MRDKNEKEKIRVLRSQNGLSISEIQKIINVPYETIKRWVKDIPLTKEQSIELAIRNPNYKNGKIAGKIYSKKCKDKRLYYQACGREIAKNHNLSLWVIGSMLYWGEGSKCSRNLLDFTNSDPYMIKLFMRFLVEELKVEKSRITISINCYDDLQTVKEIEKFWIGVTGLNASNLRKTIVNKYPISSKKQKKGKSQYGTCKIRVCDVEVVQKIYGFIKEVARIEEKEIWL